MLFEEEKIAFEDSWIAFEGNRMLCEGGKFACEEEPVVFIGNLIAYECNLAQLDSLNFGNYQNKIKYTSCLGQADGVH